MKIAKKLLVGVSVLSAVGLLSACGNDSNSTSGKTTEIEFFNQKKRNATDTTKNY